MNTVAGPLRAVVMVGGSQVVNVVISIVRVKLVALFLGPSGIGLLGLFSSLKDVATTAGGLGLATSGVRQIARDADDPVAQAATRRVLLWGLAAQGAIAALVIWLLRDLLAERVFAGTVAPNTLGFIALAVWIGLVASAISAVIQGMRRIADLVRVTVFGALIGTVLGLAAIGLLGARGLPLLVLALSVGQVLAAVWFLRRIAATRRPGAFRPHDPLSNWGQMVRLGLAFMVGALLTSATLLIVRALVQHRLGLGALGQFEAAWALTMTYLGFVLNAMAADYFPRLSGAIDDPEAANTLVNQQIQIALVLGGPLILATIGLAPVVLALLYSSEFTDAVAVMQWQTVGNVLKLGSWSMGFTVAAAGRGGLFTLLQLNFNLWFLGLVWWQIDNLGLLAVGVAFVAAYGVQFIATQIAARRLVGFRWDRASLNLQLTYAAAAVALLVLVRVAPLAGALTAVLAALVGAVLGLRFLLATVGTSHPVAARIDRFFSRIGWRIGR